jgi:hypothetical protein
MKTTTEQVLRILLCACSDETLAALVNDLEMNDQVEVADKEIADELAAEIRSTRLSDLGRGSILGLPIEEIDVDDDDEEPRPQDRFFD